MKLLAILCIALMLAGCAGTQPATIRSAKDSTCHYTLQLDSLYRAFWQRDSVYRRDSIYISVKGDTVTEYVEKTLYAWRTRTDTVYRDRVRVDTLYIERTDSVTVEKPVYIEMPVKWYDQGFIWIGRMCLIALILWTVFLYLRQKF